MKVDYNLDFDEFLAEVYAALTGTFANQAEFDAINQFSSTSSFFPITRIWTRTLFRQFLHTYICLGIYPGTLGVAAIEV